MKKGFVETTVGFFVLLGFAAFCWLAFQLGEVPFFGGGRSYTLEAMFDNVSGVKKGAPVQVAGVVVGKVAAVGLGEGRRAKLELRLDRDVKIPADSVAAIKSQGIIGDKYVQLSPGESTTALNDGESIALTESAVDIEQLLSGFGFGGKFSGSRTYDLRAVFDNIAGVKVGATVQVAGVVVGEVRRVRLNGDDEGAEVVLRLDQSLQVPVDSMASVKTMGIIGGKYIQLSLGGDEELFKPGGVIVDTESSVDIESLISKLAFGSAK